MKKLSLFALTGILFLAFMSSCKYEEGPAFSLRSKKERVANKWAYGETYIDGERDTILEGRFAEEYTKDGDILDEDGEKVGIWELSDKKETLILQYNDAEPLEVIILTLKENELKVTYEREVSDGEGGTIMAIIESTYVPY